MKIHYRLTRISWRVHTAQPKHKLWVPLESETVLEKRDDLKKAMLLQKRNPTKPYAQKSKKDVKSTEKNNL